MFSIYSKSRIQPILGSFLLSISLILIVWAALQFSANESTISAAELGESESGSLLFSNEDGKLAEEDIRLLCFNSPEAQGFQDLRFVTTTEGQMPIALPADCAYAAAMQLWHTQPSGKPNHGPAYWVYTTSWQPGTTELTEIAAEGTTKIIIDAENTLVLFNLVASLAWEPPTDDPYVDNLLKSLGDQGVPNPATEHAASYLHALTDGTMTFGPITVHRDGNAWESADIRVLPANDLKPSAQVGGIVSESIKYTSTITATTVYSPGAIILGRNWLGCAHKENKDEVGYALACGQDVEVGEDSMVLFGAGDSVELSNTSSPTSTIYGNWDDGPGYRTLVHEWAHYGLFLYDEYQTIEGHHADCISTDNSQFSSNLASIMDWHYTSNYFWESGLHADCAHTKQYHVHGLSDCETLSRWYVIQELANAESLPPIGCGNPENAVMSLGLTKHLVGKPVPVQASEVVTPASNPVQSIYLPLQAAGESQRFQAKGLADTLHSAPFENRSLVTAYRAKENYGFQIDRSMAKQSVTDSTINALINVKANLGSSVIDLPHTSAQAYLLRPNAADSFERIWNQGRVITESTTSELWEGHVTLLGAQESVDRVKVFGESFTTESQESTGGRWFGEKAVSPGAAVALESNSWAGSMDLEYAVDSHGQVISVTAHVTLPVVQSVPANFVPTIQLCSPDKLVGCFWNEPLQRSAVVGQSETWQATIAPAPNQPTLPNYGIVHLRVPYSDIAPTLADRELMTWYKTSGVGPGTFNANAPTPPAEDDIVTVYAESERKHCNQLIYSPATNHDMLTTSLGAHAIDASGIPQPIVGVLGQPIDIAVRLPTKITGDVESDCPTSFGLGKREMEQTDLFLTVSYQPSISVMAGELRQHLPQDVENQLLILYFDAGTGWEVVEPLQQVKDTEMNWISVPFTKDGIYAIGWVEP